jgi:hypothetical protein
MSKILKIIGRLTGGLLEWLLILLIFLAFAIRTSPVQTFLAQQATAYLSEELNTTFHVDKVSIIFFHKVALDGVFVRDLQNDTIASIETIFVTLKSFDAKLGLISLDEVNLKGGVVKINRAKETGDYNYEFIADYFDSGPKKNPKKKPLAVTLDHLRLSGINVQYDDFRKDYSSFGMDYDHLKFKKVYLFASGFASDNGTIKGFIKHLSFREKGGFQLDKFSTGLTISPEGLKLKNLRIRTPFSHIHASKLNLLMDEREDLQSFEDSVTLDVRIDKSLISLKDISYFGTALEGMNEVITLEADISKMVKNLKVENLNLSMGRRTKIQGTINLPDFRTFNEAFFQEKLNYVYVDLQDLEALQLPKDSPKRHLSLGAQVNRLGYFEARDLRIDGFYSQFVVSSDKIRTRLGSVQLDNGIMFSENRQHNSFLFEKSYASKYDVKVDSFQLGNFLQEKSIGAVSGIFFLSGEIFESGKINFNSIQGDVSRLDFMDYAYHNIAISESKFVDNVFEGKIDIADENLDLSYNGMLDLNKKQHFQFEVDIRKAMLDKLHLVQAAGTELTSSFYVDVSGTDLNNYSGNISLDGLVYTEAKKRIEIPSLQAQIQRGGLVDDLNITSKLADIHLHGKVDYKTIANDFNNQLSVIFPALFTPVEKKGQQYNNQFTYHVEVKDMDEFLAVFVPDLQVSPGTTVDGSYTGSTSEFSMDLTSAFLRYDRFRASDIILQQKLTDTNLQANYRISTFSINDTMRVHNVTFVSSGTKGKLASKLNWNPETVNESNFEWETVVNSYDNFFFNLQPSYFTINAHRWDIVNNSQILVAPKDIQIQDFLMRRENQFISLDGCLCTSQEDNLKVKINDFQLEDFASLMGISVGMKGVLNGQGTISNPFDNLGFTGDAKITGLFIDDEEVGEVNLSGQWDKSSESIALNGDLLYKNNKTFNFDGNYYFARKENNLDFNLVFDYTDIQFTNVFMDPNVVSGIRGLVEGRVKVTGTPEAPILAGRINLRGGSAKVEMFGVNFGFNGEILMDQGGIYINNMPVIDEEGNAGSVTGQIYHENFKDWKFDLGFNLEEDAMNRDPQMAWRMMPLERFLVMNTTYKEGSVYYGKAYVTGMANISGYADKLDITVNMKTQKGSAINFPMYGITELEEDSFITFASDDTLQVDVPQEIDFTGVNLDLNFDVTPDARIMLIFDDKTHDEITAYGRGDISVKLDRLNDLSIDGTYTLKDGSYNFVMGQLKQTFFIKEGGTISWNGDALNATLNIDAYWIVKANLAEIMPDVLDQKGPANQDVWCYLNLSESLTAPKLTFDIQVPKATESGKAAVARIKSDPDELNRQFVSLLLLKKFQPIQGQLRTGTGANAAFDFAENQINALLGEVSKNTRLNVDINNDDQSGEKSLQFGVSRNLLDNRLIVNGSFGVENNNTAGNSQSNFIGDVNIEYLLNQSGNFRVSVFNESNDYNVIQDKNLGQFTQGVGLHYQEEFQKFDDSKMVQYFLDIFRSKKNKHFKIKKSSRQKKVPAAGTTPSVGEAKPEEEPETPPVP